MTTNDPQQELREAYREVVLNLAGVLSVYDADDDLVWAICRSLDQVFEGRLRRAPVASPDPKETPPRRRPHTAVLELLAALDRHAPGKERAP